MTENPPVMKWTTAQCLVIFSVFCTFTLGSENFQHVSMSKTYQDAKKYCREFYTDLATVRNSMDMNTVIRLASNSTNRAWIGLEAGNVSMWHWSQYDHKPDFFNWRSGEPHRNSRDACAAMDREGKWFESDCGIKRNFVCQGDGETSSPLFVADTKSWRNAQSHCRDLSSDLVSIHSRQENRAVQIRSDSQTVWIGLFKDPWMWSDGSNSSFRFWKPFQPNYREGQDCTAAVFKNTGQWNDLKCNGKRTFVCQGARKPKPTNDPTNPTIILTTSSEDLTSGRLTEPPTTRNKPITKPDTAATEITTLATPDNSTTLEPTTTPETTISIIPGIPTTVEATTTAEMRILTTIDIPATTEATTTTGTSISTTTDLSTTPEVATTTETMMSNTTVFEPYTSLSPEVDNTTIKMPNVTRTQPKTANGTTHSDQMLTMPEDLILIQENLTWIEAMGYCREHHVDLVPITSKDVQDKVAEKAKNSTSSHVWLGLRYTCNFKFWFWTGSTSACYQNWVPGQGPDRDYDCGVSGAMEATGRQQWVGLPEAERLNFVCSTCDG